MPYEIKIDRERKIVEAARAAPRPSTIAPTTRATCIDHLSRRPPPGAPGAVDPTPP